MKKHFATILVTAVLGFLAAYFLTNLIAPSLSSFSFKTLSQTMNFSLTDPSDEIFNYRAINPTVEVFVGECESYNPDGSCADDKTAENPEENQENTDNNQGNNQDNNQENTPGEE